MTRYMQFNAAQSIPIAAANEGSGTVGTGVGLGVGITMAQQMMNAIKPQAPSAINETEQVLGADSKFCIECGKTMPARGKFCPKCGGAQD